uniref:TGFb_propeptide domain-containing protein n=1 Tax=Macrostomum lignano TaxID=282301 RepID=A0A1I8FS97_9PLAT
PPWLLKRPRARHGNFVTSGSDSRPGWLAKASICPACPRCPRSPGAGDVADPGDLWSRDQVHRSLHRIERHLTRRDPAAMQKLFDAYSAGTFADPRNTKPERSEHLKIPQGIALRSLIVPPAPDALFTEDYPDMPIDEILQQQQALNGSIRTALGEAMSPRDSEAECLDDWVFLYFRVQKRNWESTVSRGEEERAATVNMYAGGSEWGWKSNPNIIFWPGRLLRPHGRRPNIYGELQQEPCAMISFNSTPKYVGLEERRRHLCELGDRHPAPDDGGRAAQEGAKEKAKDQGEGEGESRECSSLWRRVMRNERS